MVMLLVLALFAALGAGLGFGWYLGRRATDVSGGHQVHDIDERLHYAVASVTDALRAEQGRTMQAAVDTVVSVAASKFDDQLAAGHRALAGERDAVGLQLEAVSAELGRMSGLVANLQTQAANTSGRLESGLEQAAQVTAALHSTTRSLEQALASPKARGQWGERMAEDVLRAAGFVEGINYHKQTKQVGVEGGGIPDYTFPLPRGHVVHMDVKFPIDNYRRWLAADDDAARNAAARQFQRDARDRIRELGERTYADPDTTVEYVLLFVPNESVYGFLHEHDPTVIDVALGHKVVLCSPTTLFAVLAIVRQAVDNFLVEKRSDEILGAVAGLREQWERWQEPLDKMRRGLTSAQRAFDDLAGPRTRQFERRLQRLESVREDRALDSADAAGDAEVEAEVGEAVPVTDAGRSGGPALTLDEAPTTPGAEPRPAPGIQVQRALPLRSIG